MTFTGEYFGDVDYAIVKNDGKRQFTVKAITNVETYELTRAVRNSLTLSEP